MCWNPPRWLTDHDCGSCTVASAGDLQWKVDCLGREDISVAYRGRLVHCTCRLSRYLVTEGGCTVPVGCVGALPQKAEILYTSAALGTLSWKVEVPSARSFPTMARRQNKSLCLTSFNCRLMRGKIFFQPSGFIICPCHLPAYTEITVLPWTVAGIYPALSVHACGLQFLLLLLCLNFGGCHS